MLQFPTDATPVSLEAIPTIIWDSFTGGHVISQGSQYSSADLEKEVITYNVEGFSTLHGDAFMPFWNMQISYHVYREGRDSRKRAFIDQAQNSKQVSRFCLDHS